MGSAARHRSHGCANPRSLINHPRQSFPLPVNQRQLAPYSLIKAFFFGIAVSFVPCYVGFNTSGGAEGVGRSTTGAVVSASVLILLLDALLANLILPILPQ